jgi:pseudouridine-5'-phosphate glycosidase
MKHWLNIHPEVINALHEGKPVVALESTIISHGMPWPKNVETALDVEQEVRNHGAVPATIAILGGKCCVGLTTEQIENLGKSSDVWKVSLRDMPYVLSQGLKGATTVAATMRIAAMAGIRIFVTGGIGGVHRGAEKNMDISADLTELGKTSVAVVSAGVKSILDIGMTLEYLETLGVPVVTFGQDAFPSFYSAKSSFKSLLRLDTISEIAEMLRAKWSMDLEGAVLVANPVPEELQVDPQVIEDIIEEAMVAINLNGISGKEITPFLLKYISEQTEGESLTANIALIKNNAAFGARLASAYQKQINLDRIG